MWMDFDRLIECLDLTSINNLNLYYYSKELSSLVGNDYIILWGFIFKKGNN